MDRPRVRDRSALACAVVLIGALLAGLPSSAAAAGAGLPGRDVVERPGRAGPPPERTTSIPLSSGELRAIVAANEAGEDVAALGADGSITIEVMYDDAALARRKVIAAGGRVLGEVDGWLLLASVPVTALLELEAESAIRHLRVPANISSPSDPIAVPDMRAEAAYALNPGEHVAKMNAAVWHGEGFTGDGIKIGIVDLFDGTSWTQAQNAGELPAAAGVFCEDSGIACNVWSSGVVHGVGVAEVIHEMAPDADLYIATVGTAADLQSAIDWFAVNDVVLVNRSLSARYDGPGDGTGPIDAVADSAVAQGMAFFNSAGNFSGLDGFSEGAYWRSEWVDADDDSWIEFDTGVELNPFFCSYILGLRWNDWGANRTDYDLYIFDEPADFPTSPSFVSLDDQSNGADPLESTFCNGGDAEVDYFAVQLYSEGGGTSGDILEFAVNGSAMGWWSNPYSANQPISDSFNPGVVSVGAIDPANGTQAASYSSWGPTNDERLKPDLAAASCLNGYVFNTFEGQCFNGTSAASPAALGAAALVLSAGLASTPAELTSWLYANAMTDRGTAGNDNIYGRGELVLPTPPPGSTPPNDDWFDAVEIMAFPFSDPVATGAATVETWEPLDPTVCGLPTDFGKTVWYTYTPIADHSITVDTFGSSFDTVITAWWYDTGENLLWEVGCNDDAAGTQSELTLSLTGGVVYYFQVGGYAAASGLLDFNASAPGPLCFGLPGTHVGTAEADTINGTSGIDVIIGRGGNDIINGSGGADIICGNDGGDTINGQGGNDLISGGGGGDTISGGNGDDTISGDNGADPLDGDGGNDVIDGRRAQDLIRGGDGDDVLNGNDNPDVIEGGAGNDRITGGPGGDQLFGDGDDDTIEGNRAPDTIRGGTGSDILDGGEGLDTIRGDGGNDTLLGGLGADTLIGGNGNDTASFEKARNPVTVNLIDGTAGGDGADTLTGIEHVLGSTHDDIITGDGGPNSLDGARGEDSISGMGGDDTIRGGTGDDTLRGNAGDDHLRGQAGNDVLNGGAGTDTLDGGGGSNACSAGEVISNC